MNVRSEDAANFAKLIMPPTYKFFNYIANPFNHWPDHTQHLTTAQLVFTIVCPHPLYILEQPTTPSSTTSATETCTSPKARTRSTAQRNKRQAGKSRSEPTPNEQDSSCQAGPHSLRIAWDISRNLILQEGAPLASSTCLHTDPFKHVIPRSQVASQIARERVQQVNCYGCNLVDESSLKALQASCCSDPHAAVLFFALQTLQYLLRHTWFKAEIFPQHSDVVLAVVSHLNSASAHVTAAAAATMCSIITHAPQMAVPVTGSVQFEWRVRTLADRCIQPDQVALNALPLIQHISHVYPERMGKSGLMSVITKTCMLCQRA